MEIISIASDILNCENKVIMRLELDSAMSHTKNHVQQKII
jgi:hypothetical protein